jgi:hypothetical protein
LDFDRGYFNWCSARKNLTLMISTQQMKKLLIFCFLGFAFKTLSQNVGINGTAATPDPSAMLDVSATDKGMLIPRVALTAANVAGPITSPLTSLLIYNTATAGTVPNDVAPGYYYWDGTKWQRFVATTFMNSAAITGIGKFYVSGININANSVLTGFVTDANCTTSSQVTASFVGALPGTNAQDANIRIINIQCQAGGFTIQFQNANGTVNYTGLQISYVAFY